jgi:hypothetical protein
MLPSSSMLLFILVIVNEYEYEWMDVHRWVWKVISWYGKHQVLRQHQRRTKKVVLMDGFIHLIWYTIACLISCFFSHASPFYSFLLSLHHVIHITWSQRTGECLSSLSLRSIWPKPFRRQPSINEIALDDGTPLLYITLYLFKMTATRV